jgi:hypothetical protein
MTEGLLIRRMNSMEARVLLGKKGITLLAILWLFAAFSGEFGCSKKVDVSQPEDFKYLEGTLVHLHKKILVVKSDDEQKVCFRAGRRTVSHQRHGPILVIGSGLDIMAGSFRTRLLVTILLLMRLENLQYLK